jgi:hypothetical protein
MAKAYGELASIASQSTPRSEHLGTPDVPMPSVWWFAQIVSDLLRQAHTIKAFRRQAHTPIKLDGLPGLTITPWGPQRNSTIPNHRKRLDRYAGM